MDSIKKLQELFARFPTIGNRTAGRFVMYLVKQPKATADELIAAIQALKNNVKLCEFCFNPFESDGQLCGICADTNRSKTMLCVVDKEADLASIEHTKKYKGRYFILAGTRFEQLKQRVASGSFTEIIVALNPTPEGKTNSVLVARALKEVASSTLQASSFKITHLATGLPIGGELEYADEETLESAFEGRK